MSNWIVKDVDSGNSRPADSRSEAESIKTDMEGLGMECEILAPGEGENQDVEIIEHTPDGETRRATPGSDSPPEATDGIDGQPDPVESERETRGELPDDGASGITVLAENPIEWLREKNDAYVNIVKGTPSISKRGFRYIQTRFEISTETEVVQWIDDPTGVIVWARAELPDGRCAEAHGEGYRFESGVDDNEFVRYADTRAKNRALADLTSSGALATEELQ